MFGRKKKEKSQEQQETAQSQPSPHSMSATKIGLKNKIIHQIIKKNFPIVAPVKTYDFSDLLRYFKYYMGSGLIDATIERRVQRELSNKDQFPARLFFGFIGVGIMIAIIAVSLLILYKGITPAAAGAGMALIG